MGTLTKKLHILKSGGTEETCNIYTTPEEVGGSPYLALEVDGAKGYVKLGSTTDANATHLRVEKNGTTYAAWKQALAIVPTDGVYLDGSDNSFTVPNGITVLEVEITGYSNDIQYVGVTPGKTYDHLNCTEESWDKGKMMYAYVTRGYDVDKSILWSEVGSPGRRPTGASSQDFHLAWSPKINKMNPTHTDY